MHSIEPVELLRRQYFQLIDIEQLTLPSKDLLRLPETQARIYNCLFNESNIVYPPPDRYRIRVLKRLVNALEEAIVDPEEDVSFPELPPLMSARKPPYPLFLDFLFLLTENHVFP